MRTTIGTTVTAGQALRGKSLVAALALALLVSVGTAAGAGAERPTGLDSHAVGCRSIYDQAKRNRDEIRQLGLTNPGSSRIDALLAANRILGQDWISLKCRDRFGSIAYLMENPFAPVTDSVHDITIDSVHDITVDSASASDLLQAESAPRVTLGDTNIEPTEPVLAPVAEPILVPEIEEDEGVTTQPVPPPVAEEIIVRELGEDEVITTQPVPTEAAEPITVPEIDEDEVITTQPVPAPEAEEIVVPELPEDDVVTTQPVTEPVAEEITVPEFEEDTVVTTEPVAAADEQP